MIGIEKESCIYTEMRDSFSSNNVRTFVMALSNASAYKEPKALLKIRKKIAIGSPKIGVAIANAPKELNTVCHP